MSWPTVPIHSVCIAAVDCVNRTAPVVDHETPYKMIRTTNVKLGFIDTVNVRHVTRETYERWTRRLVPQKGDVVLTREAPLGDVGRVTTDDKIFLGQRLFHYRADPEKLDSEFLAYVLQSPQVQGKIRGYGFGATVEHAKVGDCLNLPIPLPPLPEQRKIGEVLSAYDDLIENNRRRIALLEQAARLLYREWFVHFRFPGHETAKFADGLPEGWVTTALGEKAQILKGRNITKETVNPGSVPVVAGGLKPAYFHDTANVKGPVVTISASGANAGHVAIYFEDIWASDCSYLSVTTNPDLFFIHQLLLENAAKIRAMQKGAAQPHVYPKDLQRMDVTLPTREIINQFVQLLDPIYNQIQSLGKQNAQLAEARDLLLPRLMDGRIPVKV